MLPELCKYMCCNSKYTEVLYERSFDLQFIVRLVSGGAKKKIDFSAIQEYS